MDIATFKPSERIIEILNPINSDPLGITVSLLSLDDERMKKIKRRIQDARIALERKGKSFDAAQIDENTNMLFFSAMTGWDWKGVTIPATEDTPERHEPIFFHGEKPAFNQKNVYAVFDEFPWFREQINEELGDTKSFFR
jgi:hypothetical protein